MTHHETSLLETRGLSKRYGEVTAVKPLDLTIRAGDFVAILGPSGCGKTTLLRMIGGFVTPSEGRLLIDGRDVTDLRPDHRPTNMVFQGYGLFPHMNVRDNVSYGLRLARVPKPELTRRVDDMMRLTEIDTLAHRMIDALSGGQQQRVSLARALIMRPKILLLDEPLAALDLKLRSAMQEELRNLHREIGGTFVFVTHDQGEAMGLANRIAVMRDGQVEQYGTPEEIYFQPRTSFVATFVGESNTLDGKRTGGRVVLDEGVSFDNKGADGPISVFLRPDKMRIGKTLDDVDGKLQGEIEDVVFLGPAIRFKVRLKRDSTIFAYASGRPDAFGLGIGDAAEVGWLEADQCVLPRC